MRPRRCGRYRRNGAGWLCARPWKTMTTARGRSSRSRMPGSVRGGRGGPPVRGVLHDDRRMGWACGYRSVARSLTATGVGSGPRRTRTMAPLSTSPCRVCDERGVAFEVSYALAVATTSTVTIVMLPTEPIGSIPRPAALIEGVRGFGAGRISRPELDVLYDSAVQDTIRRLEATGS